MKEKPSNWSTLFQKRRPLEYDPLIDKPDEVIETRRQRLEQMNGARVKVKKQGTYVVFDLARKPRTTVVSELIY